MTRVEKFFDGLKNKRIAFIGTGVSHNDLISLFLEKDLDVTVCDRKTADKLGETYDKFKDEGAKFALGEGYLDDIYSYDIVFRTPGMYYNNPILQEARKMGIVITSEMETFFALCPCKIYGITGSDGKTTTTTLIAEMLEKAGKKVYKGGNIGKALLPVIEEIKEEDVAVVELSSFQLISLRDSPDVAVITNISPNHLDVHGTMEEYVNSKKNIFIHQNAYSKTVLNAENEIVNGFEDEVRGTLVKFSSKKEVRHGAFLESGVICYNEMGKITPIMPMTDIRIPGFHNVENYLTAISAVWGEVPVEVMIDVAKNFNGVEHRIEFVRELDGVKWYNDSIATSPTRVIAGLNSFYQKLIVIAGGYDKKIPYEPMAQAVNEKVKSLILMGATADKIEKAVTEYEGYNPDELKIYRVSTMEEAVAKAREIAEAGDIVTLSPASASFDLYPNFEARGQHFKRIVNEME